MAETADDWYEVVVEIPQGTSNKYEIDPRHRRAAWLDRHLFGDGLPDRVRVLSDTLAEDGDPLDALVLLEDPTFPGCHILARPADAARDDRREGRDLKILCVPAGDPRWDNVQDLPDVPDYLLAEIRHFFVVYKDLEPGKSSVIGDWTSAADAVQAIADARAAYPG